MTWLVKIAQDGIQYEHDVCKALGEWWLRKRSRRLSKDKPYESEEDVIKEAPQPFNDFLVEIIKSLLLHYLKIPHLISYKGWIDLIDHITYFESTTSMMDLDDVMKYKIFFKTFKESTLWWLSCLPFGIITSFIKLKNMFTN